MKSHEISMKLEKKSKNITCVILETNMFSESKLFLEIVLVQKRI